ncbi:MAG: hypothetical protein CM15mP113_2860 [Pseudomonadota bacterium]|nr:MAG: hypothetical protein CM15mP113_2860 [Pseudomonadota bacterium]
MLPIPTPIPGPIALEIFIDADVIYPLPAFVISKDVIVPADDTIAVADAPTFISPDVTSASTVLNC